MEACSLLVNLRKGMKSSSEQPLVGEEHCVTTLITAAKETTPPAPPEKQCHAPFLTTLHKENPFSDRLKNGFKLGRVHIPPK